jgi:hypothetical protein
LNQIAIVVGVAEVTVDLDLMALCVGRRIAVHGGRRDRGEGSTTTAVPGSLHARW